MGITATDTNTEARMKSTKPAGSATVRSSWLRAMPPITTTM